MNVAVTLEHRFDRTPDGAIWTEAMFARPFWDRYLEVFDRVHVIARVRDVPGGPEPGWKRADGERVSFYALPHFIGPSQYLFEYRRVRREIRAAIRASDAVILRTYGIVSLAAHGRLLAENRSFGVEIVADPYDAFAPGAARHPLRPLFRWLFSRAVRRQCSGGGAVAYVTEQALQRRYPPGEVAFSTYYSDVELPEAAFTGGPRPVEDSREGPFTAVSVASFNLMIKAQDTLAEAVALCQKRGLDLRLVFIGDGRHQPEIKTHVRTLGLEDKVAFPGQLPAGDAVRAELDRADVFVLASRTEGLPRAMIEAMARGLPCVGSTVGGIPELLPPEDMVPPGDAEALAEKLQEILEDPERMYRMSARNLEKAGGYREEFLYERRTSFYKHVALDARGRTEKVREYERPQEAL